MLILETKEFVSSRLPALEAVEAQIVNVTVTKAKDDDWMIQYLLASPEPVEGVDNAKAVGYTNHQTLNCTIYLGASPKWKKIFNFIAELSKLKTGEIIMADETINGSGVWTAVPGEKYYDISFNGTKEDAANAIADFLREFEGENYWFPIGGVLTENQGNYYLNGNFTPNGSFSVRNFRADNVFATRGEAESALERLFKAQQRWNGTVHGAYSGDMTADKNAREDLLAMRGMKRDYIDDSWDWEDIATFENFQRILQDNYEFSPPPFTKKAINDKRTNRSWESIPSYVQEKLVSLGYNKNEHDRIYGYTTAAEEINTNTTDEIPVF